MSFYSSLFAPLHGRWFWAGLTLAAALIFPGVPRCLGKGRASLYARLPLMAPGRGRPSGLPCGCPPLPVMYLRLFALRLFAPGLGIAPGAPPRPFIPLCYRSLGKTCGSWSVEGPFGRKRLRLPRPHLAAGSSARGTLTSNPHPAPGLWHFVYAGLASLGTPSRVRPEWRSQSRLVLSLLSDLCLCRRCYRAQHASFLLLSLLASAYGIGQKEHSSHAVSERLRKLSPSRHAAQRPVA